MRAGAHFRRAFILTRIGFRVGWVRVLVLGMMIFTGKAGAQPPDSLWSRTFGGDSTDQAYCVRQTSDGGYILTGWTESFGAGNYDMWLIRTDADGDSLWTRTFGGTGDDRGTSVVEVSDGYVVAGRTSSFPIGNENVYLVKTNFDGNTLWTRVYGAALAERAYSVKQAADDGLIVAGNQGTSSTSDWWLIKLDADGDSAWSRTYGTPGVEDWCNAVEPTADSGYVLAGYRGDAGWMVKADANGVLVWSREFGGYPSASFRDIEQTADNGYILGGFAEGTTGRDMWLVKTDANGDTLWTCMFGNPSYGPNEGYSVEQTFDGGYVLAGFSQIWDIHAWIIKTDAQGDTVWTRELGGADSTTSEVAFSVQQTADGSYLLAGFTDWFGAGDRDALLVKLGTAQPEIGVTPTTLEFGAVSVGDSTDLILIIRSTGNADLTVSDLTVTGGFHTDFTGPRVISSGDSLEVTVTFAPEQLGPQTDTLWVQSDAPGGPVSVNVSGTGIVNSAGDVPGLPKNFALSIFPNPFNSQTTLTLEVPKEGRMEIVLYDVLGRSVQILADRVFAAGTHHVRIDGSSLTTGIYFVRATPASSGPSSPPNGGRPSLQKVLLLR